MKKKKDVAAPMVEPDLMQQVNSTPQEREIVDENQPPQHRTAEKISPSFKDLGEREQKKVERGEGEGHGKQGR